MILLLSIAFLNVEKEKGFHTGTIEAVDLDNSQYWITFDKQGTIIIIIY